MENASAGTVMSVTMRNPANTLMRYSLPNMPARLCLLLLQDDVVLDNKLDPTNAVSDVLDPEDPEHGLALGLGLGPALLDVSS